MWNHCMVALTEQVLLVLGFSKNTAHGERPARPNTCDFSLMEFSWECFHGVLAHGVLARGVLASSVYYLTTAKYSQENFHGTLKNRKKPRKPSQVNPPSLTVLRYSS